jgi:hypothetical protein
MLTPVDQPLDKLEDLKQDEMYVNASSLSSESALKVAAFSRQREHEGCV